MSLCLIVSSMLAVQADGVPLDREVRPAPIRVTGDEAAVRALVDALEAAGGADRSSGRLRFRCVERVAHGLGTGTPEVYLSAAEGTAVWTKSASRWDYRFGYGGTEFDPTGPVRLRGLDDPDRETKFLLARGRTHRWDRRSEALSIAPANERSVPAALRVLPGDGWFDVGEDGDRPWAGMVDPDRSISTVTQIHGDADGAEVTATLHYQDGLQWAITGDLTNGGIVDSRIVPGTDDEAEWWSTVEAEWARADGVPYPKSLVRITEHQLGQGTTRTEWRLTISEYEPEYRPPSADMTIAGLGLPEGVAVMRYDMNGRLVSQSRSGAALLPEERAVQMIRDFGEVNAAGEFAGGETAGGDGR